MEAVRQIVDGRLLNSIVSLPQYLQNRKVEIIVMPTDEVMDVNSEVKASKHPKLGGWEDKIWMADDFDDPMEDFKECGGMLNL
jgi:hypothetical protein